MENKTIVISGGSRGLGLSLCETFLEAGYNVATFSRSATEATETLGRSSHFFWRSVDITQTSELKKFIEETSNRFGNISALINNAGLGTEGLLATTPPSAIEKTIQLNLTSTIQLTRLVVKKLIPQASGCIINISSINGTRGHSGLTVYSATKAALDGLTRSLAKELGKKGIRANSVSPGYFRSEMVSHMSDEAISRIERRTPLGRLGETQDIASVIRFLVCEAEFITGQNIVVDGGITC